MKKVITMIAVLLAFTLNAGAQDNIPEAPQAEFVMQLKVTLGETYSCGETQHGRRTVIPITGGARSAGAGQGQQRLAGCVPQGSPLQG